MKFRRKLCPFAAERPLAGAIDLAAALQHHHHIIKTEYGHHNIVIVNMFFLLFSGIFLYSRKA